MVLVCTWATRTLNETGVLRSTLSWWHPSSSSMTLASTSGKGAKHSTETNDVQRSCLSATALADSATETVCAVTVHRSITTGTLSQCTLSAQRCIASHSAVARASTKAQVHSERIDLAEPHQGA